MANAILPPQNYLPIGISSMDKYAVLETKRFRKSLKKLLRSGSFNRARLDAAVSSLMKGKPLAESFHDHALVANWEGYRECHIESNLLLIYRIEESIITLTLVNIGSHPYLFG
jgi:mRNA interferase YafQ